MRECKGPRPPNSAQGPHSEQGQPLAPHHNIQLTLPTLVPIPQLAAVSSPLQGPLSPLQASRTPSPEGFIPAPPLPSAPVAATSLRLGFPLSSLATCHSCKPPVLVPQFGGWFQSHHGAGTRTLCRFGSDIHETAFLFLVNGTKTLPQVINSSTKSLYQPLEAFRVWLSGSNHSPRRYPQACGKDYQQWLSPLLHPARKGPFHCLGDLQSW